MLEGPRGARADELPGIIGLANTVFYSSGKFDMGRGFPVLFSPGNAQNLRIFTDDGRPVAHAGMVPARLSLQGMQLSVGRVGAVCTLQEYQGRGLGTRLMDDLSSYARSTGVSTLLISGGRGLYRRMGCIDAGLFVTVSVDRSSRLPPMRVSAARWTAADLQSLSRLHDAEPVRYERDRETMAILVDAGHVECRPAELWKVEAAGRLAAYLCLQAPVEQDGRKVTRVREVAGSREAMLAALHGILEITGADLAAVKSPASNVELLSLVKTYGLRCESHGFDGTVKIIDRSRFCAALKPRIGRRLSRQEAQGLSIEAGPPTVFRLGSDELAIGGDEDLAALAFGSVERPSPAGPGALAAALSKVFPIPLPGYGLDYV